MVNYTELCNGCFFNDGSDKDACTECQGKGFFIGKCKGEGDGKLTTIERTAKLLSTLLDKES